MRVSLHSGQQLAPLSVVSQSCGLPSVSVASSEEAGVKAKFFEANAPSEILASGWLPKKNSILFIKNLTDMGSVDLLRKIDAQPGLSEEEL